MHPTGLTLGYMSLDETQLRVLSVSGTPKQKAYAQKIQPIRRNGHLLLVSAVPFGSRTCGRVRLARCIIRMSGRAPTLLL